MSDVSKTDELIAHARDVLGRVNTNAFDHDLLFQYRGGVLRRELLLIVRDLADALEAATRVPVQGEPNDDREAMLRRIESFDYGSDRVSDDLEQDIRELVALSRPTVPDAATERERLAKLVWNEKQLATEAVFKDPSNAGLNGYIAGLYRALDVIEDENK